MPQKCILYLCSKLTSWGRLKNVTLWGSLWDAYRMTLECCHFVKIHLCRRLKFEVMGVSQGRYPMNIFSEIFEDAHRTILWNSKNMQQLTFYYFMQHIWWSKIENNTRVMWFLMYFQIGVLGTSLDRHFWTPLRCPWDISSQFMRKLINLIVFASWWYAESTSIRGFLRGPCDVPPKCYWYKGL